MCLYNQKYINRLNPKYKIDVYNNAVSNKTEIVHFEGVVGCNCKDCCGGISKNGVVRSHPVSAVRNGNF